MDIKRIEERVTAVIRARGYPADRRYLAAALQDLQAGDVELVDAAVAILAAHFETTPDEVARLMPLFGLHRHREACAHTLAICQGPVCATVGGRELYHEIAAAFSGRSGFEVREGHCMGCCDRAPCASVDGGFVGQATPDLIREKAEKP